MTEIYQSEAVLLIRDLKYEDFGAYFCVASNAYGEDKGVVELQRI